MLKLGIIGTNWITTQFVTAAQASGEFALTAIYSRREESALEFGADFGVDQVMTDLDVFLASPLIDVVYIASPNSLHYPQARAALLAGKHVITEKPAVARVKELEELRALAAAQKCYYFEAARNIHEASFKLLQANLPAASEMVAANFTYMKYSSRFDAVLAGEEPNIFSPKFAGGALMDLGVYLVYAAVALFGAPESAHYFARKLVTGVDGNGTMIFRYPTFDVTMMVGKNGDSFMPSEIIAQEQTLVLNGINSISELAIHDRISGTVETLPVHVEENPMIEEARDFAAVINQPESQAWQTAYNEWLDIAHEVHALMETMRQQAGITFAGDQ